MSKKHKKHSDSHQHKQNTDQSGIHKDWRAWVVVILMLAGIAVYVLTGDESIRPGGGGDGIEMPAAE